MQRKINMRIIPTFNSIQTYNNQWLILQYLIIITIFWFINILDKQKRLINVITREFCFICSKSDLYLNIVKFQNILTRIVDRSQSKLDYLEMSPYKWSSFCLFLTLIVTSNSQHLLFETHSNIFQITFL